MRNLVKDEMEMAKKRELMLETGFRIFAEKSIEPVSMQEVAKTCGLGVATLYRYFNTKLVFVIAIGVKKWEEYYVKVEQEYERRRGKTMNAAEELEFFLDCFIDLYQNHKDLLIFNRNFDTFVKHQGATDAQMRSYNEAVGVFTKKFHTVYQKAKNDGTLEVHISEERLFTTSMYTMLSVAAKYAEGLIYPSGISRDMTEELCLLKRMILLSYKK